MNAEGGDLFFPEAKPFFGACEPTCGSFAPSASIGANRNEFSIDDLVRLMGPWAK